MQPETEAPPSVVLRARLAVAKKAAEIEDWLIRKVADLLEQPPSTVRVDRTFTTSGLDSVMVVCVAGELEVFLGRDLGAELLHEHATIRALARYLADAPPEQTP